MLILEEKMEVSFIDNSNINRIKMFMTKRKNKILSLSKETWKDVIRFNWNSKIG